MKSEKKRETKQKDVSKFHTTQGIWWGRGRHPVRAAADLPLAKKGAITLRNRKKGGGKTENEYKEGFSV